MFLGIVRRVFFVDSWPVSNSLLSGEFSIPVGPFTVPYLVEARSSFKFSSTFSHKWRWPISPMQVITVCSYSSLVRRSRGIFLSNSPRNESSYGARMGNHLPDTHTTPLSPSGTCWSDTAHPERSRDLPKRWIHPSTDLGQGFCRLKKTLLYSNFFNSTK